MWYPVKKKISHSKQQENKNNYRDKNWLIDPEMTKMIKPASEDIVTMLHMFKKIEENMNMIRIEMENIKKDPEGISRDEKYSIWKSHWLELIRHCGRKDQLAWRYLKWSRERKGCKWRASVTCETASCSLLYGQIVSGEGCRWETKIDKTMAKVFTNFIKTITFEEVQWTSNTINKARNHIKPITVV